VRPVLLIAALLVGCRTDPAPPPKPPITAESLEPAWSVPNGGSIVYVRGTNFDPKSRVRVMFGDREAPMAAVLSKDNIQVTAPKGTEGERVTVTVHIMTHYTRSVSGGAKPAWLAVYALVTPMERFPV
jgi:hypothetical protein